jgi:hypothetical protein
VRKLFLTAVSVGVFTFDGVNQLQLMAVIAFSAGFFAGRFRWGENRKTLPSVTTITELTGGN